MRRGVVGVSVQRGTRGVAHRLRGRHGLVLDRGALPAFTKILHIGGKVCVHDIEAYTRWGSILLVAVARVRSSDAMANVGAAERHRLYVILPP